MSVRRAFTLIEILVIVAIMGAMITVSIVSVNAGKGSSRLRGATRDIFAVIRYARSTALVSQQPSIITYSCEMDGEEPVTKIEVVTAHEAQSDDEEDEIETLSGEPLARKKDEEETPKVTSLTKDGRSRLVNSQTNSLASATSEKEDSFQPISEDVVRGIRIKVVKEGEELESSGNSGEKKSGISIFSNVDYLLGKYKSAKSSATTDKEKQSSDEKLGSAVGAEELQEPVSVVWEVNGRVEPHRVYVYNDGSQPEKGLTIKVDRFGAAKVLSPGEDDE